MRDSYGPLEPAPAEQRPIPAPGAEDGADEMPSDKANLIILLIPFRLRINSRTRRDRRRGVRRRRNLPRHTHAGAH